MTGWRGVFSIPSTPFLADGSFDEAGLRRVVDFCLDCGAHGLVWPVNASEFTTLSDQERLKGTAVVVEQAAGRLPVMVGCAGLTGQHAAMFARRAEATGADGVIAMCPYARKLADDDSIVAYYGAIAEATRLPICIQNHNVGKVLSVTTMARVLREVPGCHYVKEETLPATHKLSELLALDLPELWGVFGGSGGRYLLLEHARGSAGQMPGCHVTDVVVRLWDALDAGDTDEARRIYGLLAPLYALEEQCRGAIYKEVLRMRGVIGSARCRNARGDVMDAQDHQALRQIMGWLSGELGCHPVVNP